jgi:hypothetical protein
LKLLRLKHFIFEKYTEDQIKLAGGLILSLVFTLLILAYQSSSQLADEVPDELRVNLAVHIPDGYILYPFQVENFESVEPLLEAYNMVQVYDPETGALLAKNIKTLRAPKDPSHLSFLVPVNIANKLAQFGLGFKIAIQKQVDDDAIWVLNKTKKTKPKQTITFGG